MCEAESFWRGHSHGIFSVSPTLCVLRDRRFFDTLFVLGAALLLLTLTLESSLTRYTTLSLYQVAPQENISVMEFERLGSNRLKLLQHINAAKASGLNGDSLHNAVITAAEQYLPITQNIEDIRADVISHHILRLAFCGKTHTSWFITSEVALLQHRLMRAGTDMASFLGDNGMGYKPITPQDFALYREELSVLYEYQSPFSPSSFYAVPFLEALPLMKSRKLLLKGGIAYLHSSQLVQIVGVQFRQSLSHDLAVARKALSHFAQDERLGPLLGRWANGYMASSFNYSSGSGNSVDISKIDELAAQHFPLCMKYQHRALRLNHHLKHEARMQYGLYLKGIGVSMDDSINFWRSEFTKRAEVDEKVFQSRYAYNVRHNYGKEGKRLDYSPYGCAKIINTVPGVQETHGCPFRWAPRDKLMSDFQAAGISPTGAAEILKLLESHHYQIACKMYWDLTHPNPGWKEVGTTHPNEYYKQSAAYWEEKLGPEKAKEEPTAQK